jgi:hypothetical protein
MMIILLRLKNHSGDEGILRTELHQLCGDHLLDVVEVVLNNRRSLIAEFQVWVHSNKGDNAILCKFLLTVIRNPHPDPCARKG